MTKKSQSKAKAIICNPSYGNNPYIRTTEMALTLSDRLGGKISVVIPHVYGESQSRILREHFGEDRLIILDETFGAILRKVFFDGTAYSTFLRQWIETVDDVSREAREHLHATYDILCEISRSPLLDLGITPAFYNSWSRTSHILRQAVREPLITLDPRLLEQAAERMEKLEARYALHMISVPGTFEPEGNDVPIPLSTSTPETDEQAAQRGVYVTVSGIPDVGSLQSIADCLGLKIYASDSSKIREATHALPGILLHPEIVAHVARAGWGAIGTSLSTGIPLIVPAYQEYEDPEIFFNIRRIEELGLGIAFKNQTKEILLQEIEKLRPRIAEYKKKLIQRFGSMDGAEFAADKMKQYLENL